MRRKLVSRLLHSAAKATLVCALSGAVAANAATLSFSGNACDAGGGPTACLHGMAISQSYGDIPGQLDVTYRTLVGPGNAAVVTSFLTYGSTGQGDLIGVAYAGNVGTYVGEIRLQTNPGYSITLTGLDLGLFGGLARETEIRVYDSAYQSIYSSGTFSISSSLTHSHFDYSLTSANGLVLQWGPNAETVRIDNVSFNVSAVPEPSVHALMLSGLLVIAYVVRRRKRGGWA